MESPKQACGRLITALEKLVAQEVVCIRTRDYAGVADLQRKAAPIVDTLVAQGPRLADEKLRVRIANLISRRNDALAELDREISRTRERLQQLEVSQRRAAQIAPVYGRSSPSRRGFVAVG